MKRCPCRLCGWPALAWIALCAYDFGTLTGSHIGDPADDSVEVFDTPADAAAAYPDGDEGAA